MDAMSDADFEAYRDRDCWVFGDVLEHLHDPWHLLACRRRVIPAGGCFLAGIPIAQCWSVQARLSVGDLRSADGGLMDRAHIRWFTRITLLEMLTQAGWKLDAGMSRTFNEPQREQFLPALRAMATVLGADPAAAVHDPLPLPCVVRAVPA